MGILGKDMFDMDRMYTNTRVEFGAAGYWLEEKVYPLPYGFVLTEILNMDVTPFQEALDVLERVISQGHTEAVLGTFFNITKASFLWLVDHRAITSADFGRFLEMKGIRNKYAHELSEVIMTGISENEIVLLLDMHSLYRTISKWFFVEIEAPIAGYEIPENADIDNIQSAANLTFDIILNVLYNGKSEEYKTMIATIKDGRKHEV